MILAVLSRSFVPMKTSAKISLFGSGWISVFTLPNTVKNNYMRHNVGKILAAGLMFWMQYTKKSTAIWA